MGSIVKTGKFDWFFGQKAICYQSREEIGQEIATNCTDSHKLIRG